MAALLTRMSSRPNALERRHRPAGAHRRFVGDVGEHRERLARRALRSRRASRARPCDVRARDDDDRRAAVGEIERDGAADIARAAGDEGDAAVELAHRSCPRAPQDRRRRRRRCASMRARASSSARSRGQPPKRAVVVELRRGSRRRVSGSCAPPRICGWRTSRTLPSLQRRADVAGEVARVLVVRIDHVGRPSRRARARCGSVTRSSVNCSKPGLAVDEADGDAIGRRELRRHSRWAARCFSGERLPEPVHGALADLADHARRCRRP